MTAKEFISTLQTIGQEYPELIPKREIFSLAKEFLHMPVPEVVKLLHSEPHDHRMGAVSILDWKARNKKTSITEKEEVYRAYIDNHKWIDDWGMVDRAAPYVVGGYLFDKDRTPLYDLAKSTNPMERRTSIVSTYYFIRKNDTEDTFNIADILVHDQDQSVQTAVGSWIREAGKRDETSLMSFLDKHAATMPRISLRYAIEKLDRQTKDYYLGMKNNGKDTDVMILPSGRGRVYNCGTMTAIFKADETETNEKYSISEWWLEPNSDGPGAHQHEENDEVFYVLEGTITILVGNKWIDADRGTFLRIPSKTIHDFKNQTNQKTGVLNFFIPGGFERNMPANVKWFEENK